MKIYHFLNKKSVGGAEILVDELCQQNFLIVHRQFYIFNNFLEINLAKNRFFRKLLIFKSAIKIFLKLFFIRKNLLIFHLLETHLVAFLLLIIINKFKIRKLFDIKIAIYIHQSPNLYTSKLHKYLTKTISNSDFVFCYSKTVLDSWIRLYPIQFSRTKCFELRNFVSKRFSNITMTKSNIDDGINFLFVGRNVSWKRPDRTIDLTNFLSKKYPKIRFNLDMVGISKMPFIKNEINKNLKINFLGQLSVNQFRFKKYDFHLYLTDNSRSIETVGIGCLESLNFGIPVIVSDASSSTYQGKPGIYEVASFLDLFDFYFHLYNNGDFDINILSSKFKFDTSYWRHETSIERYTTEFLMILKGNA